MPGYGFSGKPTTIGWDATRIARVWVVLMWASDHPHPDSVWPNSRQAVERQMRHLSPEMRRKLTHDNATALYGLGSA